MAEAATIFFFVAMLVGTLLLSHVLQGKMAPKKLLMIHAGSFVLGLLLLILFAIITDKPEKQIATIVTFSVAALIGFLLFMQKKKHQHMQKWLAIVYQAIGMGGLIWLLIFVLN
ncbi:hypothetical protein [Pontibacter rugosus]|uniref:DUF420 domain-containing protein n=1 Tax=Pontibacter rugosus TaxID=1745966 RepID=A0ABW3STJ5_9BACT